MGYEFTSIYPNRIMRKLLMYPLVLVFLSGCSSQLATESKEDVITFTGSGYELSYPTDLKFKFERQDNSVAFATSGGASFEDKSASDYYIEIYYDGSFSPIFEGSSMDSCDSMIIGIPLPEVEYRKDDEYFIWGKVDLMQDGSIYPPSCASHSMYPEKDHSPHKFSYALCSDKGEKTVFICIKQVTDNPELAEQIFDTFRWIGE